MACIVSVTAKAWTATPQSVLDTYLFENVETCISGLVDCDKTLILQRQTNSPTRLRVFTYLTKSVLSLDLPMVFRIK